ncbi:MAG: hypothetical protein NVS2B16_27050 [Chloroflexota bacterium]
MKVRELMNSPAVTVAPSTRVASVARVMVEQNLTGLPVVNDDGELVGIVTQKDVVTKHANVHAPIYLGFLGYSWSVGAREQDDEIRRVLAVSAGDLMSSHVVSVGPEDDVDEAATLMVEKGVNPLPVVDGDRVVGVISQSDILRLVLAEEEDGERRPD